MNKQRIGILIVSILGALTSFLPWYESVELGSVSLIDLNQWTLFALFGVPIFLCLTGKSEKPLSKKKFYGAIIPGFLAILMGIFSISQFVDAGVGSGTKIKFGLYSMILLSIALPIVATKTRKKSLNEDLQN